MILGKNIKGSVSFDMHYAFESMFQKRSDLLKIARFNRHYPIGSLGVWV